MAEGHEPVNVDDSDDALRSGAQTAADLAEPNNDPPAPADEPGHERDDKATE
jgi:hypothetical protein